MKQLIGVIGVFLVLIIVSLDVLEAKGKGFDVSKEIVVNVSAAELWEMVGPGFGDVHQWSSNVDHAVTKGYAEFEGLAYNQRTCNVNVKGFDAIDEKLYKYDAAKMNLAYEVNAGMPDFVTRAANDWTVVSLGAGKSKLVMNAEFRTKGLMGAMMNGMMKKKMVKTLDTVLNDAKVYAETGLISQAKQERIAELDKKKKKQAA